MAVFVASDFPFQMGGYSAWSVATVTSSGSEIDLSDQIIRAAAFHGTFTGNDADDLVGPITDIGVVQGAASIAISESW